MKMKKDPEVRIVGSVPFEGGRATVVDVDGTLYGCIWEGVGEEEDIASDVIPLRGQSLLDRLLRRDVTIVTSPKFQVAFCLFRGKLTVKKGITIATSRNIAIEVYERDLAAEAAERYKTKGILTATDEEFALAGITLLVWFLWTAASGTLFEIPVGWLVPTVLTLGLSIILDTLGLTQ